MQRKSFRPDAGQRVTTIAHVEPSAQVSYITGHIFFDEDQL